MSVGGLELELPGGSSAGRRPDESQQSPGPPAEVELHLTGFRGKAFAARVLRARISGVRPLRIPPVRGRRVDRINPGPGNKVKPPERRAGGTTMFELKRISPEAVPAA